jgi:S1-C subfamily serine protease
MLMDAARAALLPALALLVLAGPAAPDAGGAASAANPAVFQIATRSTADGDLLYWGTAFFTGPNGTALTNSHLVYFASTDPAHYQLIALYRREFFSATVVCASPLPEPPSPSGTISRFGRDVAEIKLEPSKLPGRNVIQFRGGPEFTAHLTRLPVFPALQLGEDPRPGMPVRVTGYGLIQERLTLTPWEQWTTAGTITALAKADDGTPLLRITSADAPREGNSGSPVLDEKDRVVGMIAWASRADFSFSAGIAGSALRTPCGR